MTYERFRAVVEEMLDQIPDGFLTDLQGVHALEDERQEEGFDDVWRMGEYLDPGPDSFLGGDEGLGRHVALYWGSFRRIAEGDPEFDWEAEIWETLTHELQHHVESLAGDGRLIEQDMVQARQWYSTIDAAAKEAEADAEERRRQEELEAETQRPVWSSDREPATSDAEAGGSGGVAGWLRKLFGMGS